MKLTKLLNNNKNDHGSGRYLEQVIKLHIQDITSKLNNKDKIQRRYQKIQKPKIKEMLQEHKSLKQLRL